MRIVCYPVNSIHLNLPVPCLAYRLITQFQQQVNRRDEADAEERHEQRRAHEIGCNQHQEAARQRNPGALFLPVYEVAKPNRTPHQRGKEEIRVQHSHSMAPRLRLGYCTKQVHITMPEDTEVYPSPKLDLFLPVL